MWLMNFLVFGEWVWCDECGMWIGLDKLYCLVFICFLKGKCYVDVIVGLNNEGVCGVS